MATANLRRVAPYLRPHRARMAFILVSALVSIAAGLSTPLLAKAVIDGPITRGDARGVVPWAVLAVALGALETGLGRLRRVTLGTVATSLETELRDDLYRHLQRLDVGFHDQWQSGQLLSRATSDISIIRRFAAFGAIFLVIISIEVVGIFVVLFRLHWPLALVAVAFAVPVLVLCRRFEAQYSTIVRDIQDQLGDMTTEIEEAARGMRVIKAFGRSRHAFTRYDRHITGLHRRQLDRIAMHTKFVWLLGVVPNLTLTAVLLAGALAVGHGAITVGGLVAFISYVLFLVFPLEALAWILAMAQEAVTAADRVYEVLDTAPLVDDGPDARPLPATAGHVRFEDVHFAYPGTDRPVLRGLGLEVAPGETVALVGETGSGKSTVAALLARLYDPTAGRITLDGVDLRDITLTSLRGHIGFGFEDATLFSASVRENLRIGHPDATEDDIEEALRVAQAHFVHELPWGLDTRIGEQGMTLSGGQRQRLALARAIIGRPPILILDDPLSALDVHTEALVEDALRPMLADRTALVVVHRPSTIALADRAALLEDGRIVATGTHTELLSSEPRYRAILAEESERPETPEGCSGAPHGTEEVRT